MRYVLLVLILSVAFGTSLISQMSSGEAHSARSAADLYAKHCASCHGKDGRSKTFKAKFNHARDLTDREWQELVSDERIFNSIMNGRGRHMPKYEKKLSEQEIESLVPYIRNLKR